jgi:hypothetical protein
MSRLRQGIILVGTVGALLLVLPIAAPAEGQEIHGENSSFVGQGVAMVWGVLRGAREDDTQAVLRIAPAGGAYVAVSIDGVDPFTQARRVLLARRPLGTSLDVRTPRATFADLPRREIHFFAGAEAAGSALTVYFMGLPDTTPEFASEVALVRYLDETLAKLTAPKGRTP